THRLTVLFRLRNNTVYGTGRRERCRPTSWGQPSAGAKHARSRPASRSEDRRSLVDRPCLLGRSAGATWSAAQPPVGASLGGNRRRSLTQGAEPLGGVTTAP